MGAIPKLNMDCLDKNPQYCYCGTVMEIAREEVGKVCETAGKRWREYTGPRRFRAERAVLVQNTLNHQWIDLAEYALGAVALR